MEIMQQNSNNSNKNIKKCPRPQKYRINHIGRFYFIRNDILFHNFLVAVKNNHVHKETPTFYY